MTSAPSSGLRQDAALPPEVNELLRWLAVERGRAPSTLEAYRRDLHRYLRYLGVDDAQREPVDLAAVTEETLVAYVAALREEGLAPRTVARAVVVTRLLHRFLAVEGVTTSDPSATLPTPHTPKGIPKALDEQTVARLLDSVAGDRPAERRDRAILEVLYGCGLRISELVGLGFGDVDLDHRVVRVLGKGSKERIVPLGGAARRALECWLDEGGRPAMVPQRWRSRGDADAVFLNQRGGRLTRQGAWLVLRGRCRDAGIDAVHPHMLRHSCATHMLDRGADLRAVQELLGHASISTTQIYTKVANQRLWDAYREAHPRARLFLEAS